MKYLFAYISKGQAVSRIAIVPDDGGCHEDNEVTDYVSRRYIGASDAAWRVLEFNLTGREPTVEVLPVHLQDRNFVLYRRGQEREALDNATSRLMLYFNRPRHPDLDNLTYVDYYERYRVTTDAPGPNSRAKAYPYTDGSGRYARERVRRDIVCRLFFVSPNRGELYYLRMLLSRYPCRSYGDLMALGGPDCATLQQAARALGLLNDEQEYSEALEEAATFMSGRRLRSFFITLVLAGAPARVLWDSVKHHLCEDFTDRGTPVEQAERLALVHIDRGLRRSGSSAVEQGLPHVPDDSTEAGRILLETDRVRLAGYAEEWSGRLNDEQRRVFDYVTMVASSRVPVFGCPSAVFLQAAGGCGKTAVCKAIAARLRSDGNIVLCVASSGIAALIMEGGRTAHNMFRFPLDFSADSCTWGITNGTQRADLIRRASLIIFDEACMADRRLLELLDRSLKDLMGNSEAVFGGKPILLCGDFRQLCPVNKDARTPLDITSLSVKHSYLWPHFKKMKLTRMQRIAGAPEYVDAIEAIGDGRRPEIFFPEGNERLVALDFVQTETDLEAAVNFAFPAEVLADPDVAATHAVLSTHNGNVDEINAKLMDKLPGEERLLFSADYVPEDQVCNGDDLVDPELLHSAGGPGIPPHVLRLKVGAVCLVTRNLNQDEGLVNGSKVIVVGFTPHLVIVRRPGEQEHLAIPRIVFRFPIVPRGPMDMCRRQYPLRVAYSLTIHKSQGQTLMKVVVDLRSDVFSHGQLYVALSRVTHPGNIRVLLPLHRVVNGVGYTRNIVYPALAG